MLPRATRRYSISHPRHGDDMEPNQERVEAVAKAIYSFALDRARKSVDSLEYNSDKIPSIFRSLKSESQIAQILVFSSFLEDCVRTLIKARFKHLDTKNVEAKVFGGNGPLGTFSNRLLIAFQLGWLTSNTMGKLSAFKNLRNEFAHHAFERKITDQHIKDHIKSLSIDAQSRIDRCREAFEADTLPPKISSYGDLRDDEQLLMQFLFLYDQTVRDLLVLPNAILHHVSPFDIVGDFDTGSTMLKSHQLAISQAFLELVIV